MESNDEGYGEVDFAGGGDDAACDDVALHDAAKDVYEDAFDVGVGEDNFEGGGDLLFVGASADVKEVGGFASAAMMSMVAMARPAPLTRQAMLPSSAM